MSKIQHYQILRQRNAFQRRDLNKVKELHVQSIDL